MEAPIDGILQEIFIAAGQAVPAALNLFSIAGTSPVWVKIPVYVGDLSAIDLEKSHQTARTDGVYAQLRRCEGGLGRQRYQWAAESISRS